MGDGLQVAGGGIPDKENSRFGNSLAVQWLGLRTFTTEVTGSIPGEGTKILQAMRGQKRKKKRKEKKTVGASILKTMLVQYYDFVIYNKKYVFGLPPVPGTELLKHLEFPVIRANRSIFYYVSEVTFGKPLGNLRMGACCQGNKPCMQLEG